MNNPQPHQPAINQKEPMQIELHIDNDYKAAPVVIEITTGEFIYSDQYPIYSDSYLTCLGVVFGAVNGHGVCLAHLDPESLGDANDDDDDELGIFYRNSLTKMANSFLRQSRGNRFDVLFFADKWDAVTKFQLERHLQQLTNVSVRNVVVMTKSEHVHIDTAIVMPSHLYSAVVSHHKDNDPAWSDVQKKKVWKADDTNDSNEWAGNKKVVRELHIVKPGKIVGED